MTCSCPSDWAHGCFARDCPRAAVITEASRTHLARTLEIVGEPWKGVTCPAMERAMTPQEKIKHAETALRQIVDEAKRDPKVDPEKLRQIARDALEMLSRT